MTIIEANNLIAHYIAEIEDLEFELGQSNRIILKQQAEIERLKDENCHDYHCMCLAQQEKAELQKQVDEFEDMRDKAIEVCDSCHKKYAQKIEKAVKDTVKEITEELLCTVLNLTPYMDIPQVAFALDNCRRKVKEIAKRKGVEAE